MGRVFKGTVLREITVGISVELKRRLWGEGMGRHNNSNRGYQGRRVGKTNISKKACGKSEENWAILGGQGEE